MLQDLIKKLQDEHGISAEQSNGVINSVVQYIKEKFPMVGGMLDHLQVNETGSTQSNANTQNIGANESTFGKIEDFAKDKLGSFFGGNKV